MKRDHWRRVNAGLDPERDYVAIYRNLSTLEFPWDTLQALSFALFRTYAVPGIGALLDETRQFGDHAQKRYDDTALLLEPPSMLGFDHPEARAAIRRINQMHRSYDIPDHEMLYVLATFVVVPKRWMDDYAKRPFTEGEVRASVAYYRELGRHMGIRDIPETYAGFADLMDAYEAEHFALDAGGRRVADATLRLLLSFYPRPLRPLVEVFSRALMDDPLLEAFGYRRPPAWVVRLSRAGLRLRGRLVGLLPPRRTPRPLIEDPRIRSYPDGYRIDELGTFPQGCPVPHAHRSASAS
ncbi:oxygenase MpaB family protein [Nocardioides daejeonensis]|uniref:oxygenase MpaB family protein n=1 Tax=Nocardioides daejeonensis TaxID=1046556 RepID=UPI000D746C54|nr:oxygenase MpaB family protein [Nocardioides daejeonensis]